MFDFTTHSNFYAGQFSIRTFLQDTYEENKVITLRKMFLKYKEKKNLSYKYPDCELSQYIEFLESLTGNYIRKETNTNETYRDMKNRLHREYEELYQEQKSKKEAV